jgi:arylsulfatase A-like enzyme
MRKFYYLLFVLSIISCKNKPKASTQKTKIHTEKPNIILLVGDDQGYPYFGFMGATYVQTPNMDKLAASGTLFTEGYVPQNHCRPSLQTLMTGTLPTDYNQRVEQLIKQKQIPDSAEVDFKHHAMKYFTTLPKILSNYGYKSFQGGKWWI